MFAGIDVASERHMLARLDAQGVPLGKPVPITEDWKGYDTLLRLLGPLMTRRFQDSALERTKTDAIDATGVARFAFEKRPEATQLHDIAAEALCKRFAGLDWPGLSRRKPSDVDEFTRYGRGLDSMLATTLIFECPTAHDAVGRQLDQHRMIDADRSRQAGGRRVRPYQNESSSGQEPRQEPRTAHRPPTCPHCPAAAKGTATLRQQCGPQRPREELQRRNCDDIEAKGIGHSFSATMSFPITASHN